MKLYRHMNVVADELKICGNKLYVLPRVWTGSPDSTIPAGLKSFWHEGEYFPALSDIVVKAQFEPDEHGIMSYEQQDWNDKWHYYELDEYTAYNPVRVKIVQIFVPEEYFDFRTGRYYINDVLADARLQTPEFYETIKEFTPLSFAPKDREIFCTKHCTIK